MGEPRSAMRFVGLDTVALIELVRAGDYDAYGELFTRYRDFAHKVARRASRRHADDLVAESFRRVLTAISHGAGPTQAFGPYLAATIRSSAAGLAAPYQEVELDVNNLLTDEHGDVDPRVSNAYLSLPEQWQNALWYSDVEGLSPRHAAPLLGLPTANAFSALRKRARAGLRSAYLTQVVDEACNEDVRRHLEMLMAGTVTAETVDDLVDQHLRECDECAAIAWRVAAVTGNRVGLVLAPALLAFHGFATSGALLPVGFGLPGLFGWFRRLPKSVAAAGTTTVVGGLAVAAVAIGSTIGGGNGGVPPAEGVASPIVPSTDRAAARDDDTPPGVEEPARDEVDTPSPSVPTTATAPLTSSTVPAAAAPSTTAVRTTTTVAHSSPSTDVTSPSTTTKPVLGSTGGSTTVPSTTVPGTVGPSPTTTAVSSSTAPSSASTSTTTTTPATSTSTTTSTTTTTTTSTTSTSTTTTTAPVPPARLRVGIDTTVGSGADLQRLIRLDFVESTGAPGAIGFSRPIDPIIDVNLSCTSSGCALPGNPLPGFVVLRTAPGPLTIVLRDAGGAVVQTISLP